MDTTRRRMVLEAAALAASAVVGTGCATRRFSGNATAASDWVSGLPGPARVEPAAWADAMAAAGAVAGLRSLLVVQDGVLVGERYQGGADAQQLQPINSATKSVVSLLVGQALQQGRIASLDEPLHRLLPGERTAASPVADVTLGQILRGHSGQRYDWATQGPELAGAADPVAYALHLPRDPAQPPAWRYNDAAVGLLAPILRQAQGLDLAALAQRDLFEPLGIVEHAWRRDRLGQPTAYGGLALRCRDLLKLAWLAANGGRWRGAQVVPEAWIAASTRPHAPASWGVAPIADVGYGYLWFTGRLHGHKVAWGWGYGGQFALTVPALRLAVATAATSPPPAQLGAQTGAVMAVVARLVRLAGAA